MWRHCWISTRERKLDRDRVLNEAVRAGLSSHAPMAKPRFVQPTHHLGTNQLDLTKPLALADELENDEIVRKLKSRDSR
jgi:hypothetical protein